MMRKGRSRSGGIISRYFLWSITWVLHVSCHGAYHTVAVYVFFCFTYARDRWHSYRLEDIDGNGLTICNNDCGVEWV